MSGTSGWLAGMWLFWILLLVFIVVFAWVIEARKRPPPQPGDTPPDSHEARHAPGETDAAEPGQRRREPEK